MDGNCVTFDDKLMVVEQNPNFPEELLGDTGSIIYHSNKALQDNQIFIDVQFEKANLTLMTNKQEKASICLLNKKK